MLKIIGIILVILVFVSFLNSQIRDYLNEHIQSLFFKEARYRAKEKELIGSVDVYSPRVEEIQNILKSAGFFWADVDGLMGRKTRQAIKNFQRQKGINPTGIIDETTYSSLLKERELQNIILNQRTPTIIQDSSYKEISPERITPQEIAKIAGPQEKIETPKDRKKQIQVALKKAGLYLGPIDGKIGPKTRQAIKAFQKKNNLKPDGIVGKATWEKLKQYLP